jgi:hypothetical protein
MASSQQVGDSEDLQSFRVKERECAHTRRIGWGEFSYGAVGEGGSIRIATFERVRKRLALREGYTEKLADFSRLRANEFSVVQSHCRGTPPIGRESPDTT